MWLNLKYNLTLNEYQAFNYYTGWQSPGKKNYRIKYYAKALIFYFAGLVLIFSTTKNFHLDVSFILIVTVAIILLITYLRYRIKAHYDNSVKKMIDESGENKILPLMDVTFNESGIIAKTNEEEVKYTWSAIMKKIEVNDSYYLYINSRQALIIPQRVFANQNEKEEFKKLLAQHLSLQAEFPLSYK